MPAYAVHAPHLAPSGTAHAVSLDLTSVDGFAFRGKRLGHLITARDDCLSVYEVRQKEEHHENVKFILLRRHRAFGLATGLRKVQLDATADDDDGRDRLLVSFKDAKMALMEWSDSLMDLQTVSIHTYERAPQLSNAPPPNFLHQLAMDPVSRCAVLLLPHDALAVLPFFQDAAELELLDALEDESGNQVQLERSLPYSPSFLLPFVDIDTRIKNVKDVIFLADFQRPTMAVLFCRDLTWTGRLNERRDAFSLYLITLDLTISSKHPIISTREELPYNSLYLVACPAHLSGGVLLITTTAILHIDQGGRIVGVAVSAWHEIISNVSLPLLTMQGYEQGLDLSNSHVVFAAEAGAGVRSNEALLFLQDGSTFSLVVHLDGRTISSLELKPLDSGSQKRATPSLILAMGKGNMLFMGSLLGNSEMWRVETRTTVVEEGEAKAKVEEEMDLDLDEDLYGDSLAPDTAPGARTLTELYLSPCASLLGLGPVLDLKPCVLHQPFSPPSLGMTTNGTTPNDIVLQSVACTGAAPTGGLTFFEPKLVSRKRKRVVKADAPRGVWSLSSSFALERKGSLALTSTESESVLCAIDAEGKKEEIKTLEETTITAASLPDTQGIWARATPRGISVVSAEGEVIQAPSLLSSNDEVSEGEKEQQEVYQAHVVGKYSVLVLANASLALHVYSPSQRTFSRTHEAVLAQETTKRYTAASLFLDTHAFFASPSARKEQEARERKAREERQKAEAKKRERERREAEMRDRDDEVDYEADDADAEMGEPNEKDRPNGTSADNGAADGAAQPRDGKVEGKIWLVLLRNDGSIEIRDIEQVTLPLVWQSNSLNPAPATLEHAQEQELEEGMYVSRACLALVGDVPHLVVTYENGLLVVYEAIPFSASAGTSAESTSILPLSFTKTFARQLAVSRSSTSASDDKAEESEAETVSTSLTPFRAWAGLTGVFVGGEKPGWLVRTLTGPLGLVESAEKGMDAFAPVFSASAESDEGRRFLFSRFGAVYSAALPQLSFDLDIPHRHVATGRTYTKVTAHAITRTVVAASESPMAFQLFDPEDQTVVQDPSIDPSPAYAARGSLELFTEDGGEPVDGFEFEPYETVCAIQGVTLSSVSTLEGTRDYIAVGTVTAHGEDRPARGNVYIFDVVEVVPHPDDPGAKFRLRLVCKDDCKAPITTIADINGFLVVTMGQKLFVRSLENDEWLVTIAFLDIPYQSTMLRRLKNYLLLSDVAKATWLIAFQESPYKLSVVAKDFIDLSCTTGDYLINGDQMAIITTALDRVVRLLDYAPTVPASQGGLKLMLRTEYRIASEPSSSLMVPGASDGGFSQQSEIVYALHNGAIETVVPVDEEVFARLQVLQSQMVRNVQHFAGLNPRGYRAVRNELYSRPQTKGILDGLLLSAFERLPRPKMDELVGLLQGATGAAGADQVLRDLASIRTHWGSGGVRE